MVAGAAVVATVVVVNMAGLEVVKAVVAVVPVPQALTTMRSELQTTASFGPLIFRTLLSEIEERAGRPTTW